MKYRSRSLTKERWIPRRGSPDRPEKAIRKSWSLADRDPVAFKLGILRPSVRNHCWQRRSCRSLAKV